MRLSTQESAFAKFEALVSERTFQLEGIKFTAIEVDHSVPTLGFVIEASDSSIAIVSDTGPTTRIWELLNETPNLKTVFLETAFPNHMQWLANVSCHLTPQTFAEEVKKLRHDVQWIIVHQKAEYADQITHELQQLGLPNLAIAEFGREYVF